jgi:hypothetical protein
MASGSHDGTARIWDTATWRAVGGPLTAPDPAASDDSVEAVAFSPDGRTLAVAAMSGRILLWNLQTRDRIALPRAHANAVTCVAFSPDGRTMASGSLDETIRLWNIATGRELMILSSKELNLGQVRSLSFSPDSTQLLAGTSRFEGGAVVWSTAPSLWDNPALAASRLEPLLRPPVGFQSRVRILSEIPQLPEALETLDARDRQVQAAQAAARANQHAARQQWTDAAREFDRLVAADPTNPEGWLRTPGLLRLSMALLHENRHGDAAALLRAAAKHRASDELTDDDRAIGEPLRRLRAAIQSGLAKEPRNPGVLELRAELAGLGSDRKAQVADYTAAIDTLSQQKPKTMAGDLERLYGRRGNAYVALKQWQQAVDDYAHVTTDTTTDEELRSSQVTAVTALARTLAEQGKQHLAQKQPAQAQAELEKSREILTRLFSRSGHWTVPTNDGATLPATRARLLDLKDREVADLHVALAKAHAQQGHSDEAFDSLAGALPLTADRAGKATIIAEAAALEGVLEKLAERAAADALFQVELARYDAAHGNARRADAASARARALFEANLAKEPENSVSAAELAEVLLLDSRAKASSSAAALSECYVRLGKQNEADGIDLVDYADDGATEPALVEGQQCRLVQMGSRGFGYAYFAIENRFKWAPTMKVQVEIDYWADNSGDFQIQYDSHDGSYNGSQSRVQLDGSRGWKTARFALKRARFANSQNGRADFRVSAETAGHLYLKRVSVGCLFPGDDPDDPWTKLAAAYLLTGDTQRAAELLAQPGREASIASLLEIGLSIDTVLDFLQGRHPEKCATLLQGSASVAAERGQIDEARTLYTRLARLQPKNGVWKERIEQLRPGVLAVWDFDRGPGPWRDARDCELSGKDGVLTVRSTGRDPFFSTPVSGPAGGKAIVLRYRADEAFTMQVFWSDSWGGLDESRHGEYPLPATAGAWREAVLPFSAERTLNLLRLNPNTAPGHRLEMDLILLRELEPGHVGSLPAENALLTRPAAAYQSSGRTREAVPLLAQASAASPKDTCLSLKVAALQAWFGQEKELAATLQRIRAFAQDTKDAATAEQAAKACSIRASGDKAELEAALAIARRGLELSPRGEWNLLALGMAEYRCGNDVAAAEALLACAQAGPDNLMATGIAAFYRAMSLFRQGKHNEARKLAIETAARMKPLPKDEQNPLPNDPYPWDDLILWLAYKEAKAMIQFDEAPAAAVQTKAK